MKIGLISDVHSNRIALEAVLDDMPDVDELLCAGDVVGYNPWPGECVDLLRDLDVPTVMGNHDQAVVDEMPFRFNEMARDGVEHAVKRLDESQREWLADLPTERLEADGRVKVIHGHPDNPNQYTYPKDFSPGLLDDEDVLVLGHTHVQHHAVFTEGIVINPGSVGQPRDGDPDAAYSVVDLDALTVDEHRVSYDIDAVIEAVDEAGLHDMIGSRLPKGK